MSPQRTDLAIEAGEIYREINNNTSEIDGVLSNTEKHENYLLTKVEITNKNGEKALNRKCGKYITFECELLLTDNTECVKELIYAIKKELNNLLGDIKNKKILVCGLGNRDITPDSIGPYVIDSLLVTRHLKNLKEDVFEGFTSVSAIAPGVLGVTGIESAEIIKGLCDKIHPDIIIAIDALAARKLSRLCTSIQLCDTGITPGSGIGNRRDTLDKASLSVPVIAIGVPTVTDTETVAYDILNQYKLNTENQIFPQTKMLISPKDIDLLSKKLSHIISKSINYALQPMLSEEDIDMLCSQF